jgi:transglutaminase-like putative cysteine protease
MAFATETRHLAPKRLSRSSAIGISHNVMKVILMAFAGALVFSGAAYGADIDQVFAREIKRGRDNFEFTYRVKLPALSNSAKLWMPAAQSDSFQRVRTGKIELPNRKEIAERPNGNKILFTELQPADSGKTIEANYTVIRREKQAYAATEDPGRYLKPERLVPMNETFTSLARAAIKGKSSVMEQGRAIYDHTLDRMKYDKSGTGWGRGDAQYACDARTGNCTDFHAYFIALARAVNIPARFAIGFTIPADKNEGVINGYHCWAEFLADGKWVPVDISEADKNPELAEYYFGHHPANRFELTQGRDLVFEPAPVDSPVNFLIYPVLEVDGKAIKTENEFSFRRLN